MSAETKIDLQLEIAHLLLIDVVGYSKLLVDEQVELLQRLNEIVRNTESFRVAEKSGKLIRLSTGDGMALLFYNSPEEPARCALEISKSLENSAHIRLRMGVHSGPVNRVTDVNDQSNVAGSGINVAQRVMDCGDAGHILLSKHLADDLAQYRHWRPFLHDLGECEVKHGLRLHLVNLFKENLGNPQVPQKLRRGRRWQQQRLVWPITMPRWNQTAVFVALLLSGVALVVTFVIPFRRNANDKRAVESTISPILSRKSIAVLPFANLSNDKDNAFLADGVQDAILNDLANVADLKVISRTSVMEYRADVKRNVREIGKQLEVAHIVEGTVQRVGDRVRISAQLIDATNDVHLWAEHYDRDVSDIFAIETELAEQIVSQLKAKLSPDEKTAIESPSTADLAAHELYVRAKGLMARSVFTRQKENLYEAVRLLTEAVRRDPIFFLAYCNLASAHDQIYLAGMDRSDSRLALAQAAIDKAQKIDPNSGQTRLALADHLYCVYLDFYGAQRELELARRTLPNEPHLFELAGYIDRRQGRWNDCVKNLRRALEFDPRNFAILQNLALTFDYMRLFSEEVAVQDKALQLLPKDVGARVQRAAIELKWHGNTKPLHSQIQDILSEDPSATAEVADAWVFLALSERDYRMAELALAALPPDGTHNSAFSFPRWWSEACVARALGDHQRAQSAFEGAREEVEKAVLAQPNYGEPLSVLGMIDAGLGRKEQAIREARRAVELLPLEKDAINGSIAIGYLARVYAWLRANDEACQQLAIATRLPGDISYGELQLHPDWDGLRGDHSFEQILASLKGRP